MFGPKSVQRDCPISHGALTTSESNFFGTMVAHERRSRERFNSTKYALRRPRNPLLQDDYDYAAECEAARTHKGSRGQKEFVGELYISPSIAAASRTRELPDDLAAMTNPAEFRGLQQTLIGCHL